MINNRQNGNGRRRGRTGGAPRPNGGSGTPDRGSRLDNRARGNASQLHEKYKTLAADAQRQGDRVMTEYYLQFADHYFRVLSETRSRFDEQQQRRDRYDGQGDAQGDDEDGDDGEMNGDDRFDDRPGERVQQRGQEWSQDRAPERNASERNGGDRNGGDRSGGERSNGERDGNRDGNRADGFRNEARGDGNRQNVNRTDGNRADGSRTDGGRTDGNRADGNRQDGTRRDGNRAERQDRGTEQPRQDRGGEYRQPREAGDREQAEGREPRQPRIRRGMDDRAAAPREQADEGAPFSQDRNADGPAAGEAARYEPARQDEPAVAAELPLDAPVVAERRPRGRPRKVVAPVETAEPVERMEMDRLPPAISPPSLDAAGEDEKPRRRTRKPRGEAAPADA